MRRVVLVCPGRGSYTRDLLGTLSGSASLPSVQTADAFRRALGRPTPSEMDAAESYSSRLHVAGENASVLTATCTLADADRVTQADQVRVVGVIGNSMGWYTALIVAGALPVTEGLRLIETMGQYQANNVIGGQLVYPLCDNDWVMDTTEPLEAALRDIPGLYVSIRLGRQIVLGGTDDAIRAAIRVLPERKSGERIAPFQLPLHSAFHTPLLAETAQRAQSDLGDLAFAPPEVPLVDGRGQVYFPRHADPDALRDYTLGAQVTAPYDFTVSVRTALRELAPDAFVLLGPGANLGGATAQAMLDEGWAGMHTKADFLERQSRSPLLLSLLRPEQRALVLG